MKKLIASILILSSAYAGGNIDIVEPKCVEIDMQKESYYNMALKVGTLGVGVDFSMPITNYLNARLNINGFKYSYDTTQNGIDYSSTATLFTAGALLDYYPMSTNPFRISAGVYYNGNKIDGDANVASPLSLNGSVPYAVGQIGSLALNSKLNEVAPYIGIGWGNRGDEKGWGLSVDIGAMYHGEPGIDATVTTNLSTVITPPATISPADALKKDVNAERVKLENDFKSYSFYPVVMIGATYTF